MFQVWVTHVQPIHFPRVSCLGVHNDWGPKKTINTKHINIYLTALAGQSSQGRTPTRPRDKRDKMAILLWISTENGRFVPGTGPGLSQGRVPFVPGTVPVCPEHRPAQRGLCLLFFLPEWCWAGAPKCSGECLLQNTSWSVRKLGGSDPSKDLTSCMLNIAGFDH